MDMNQMEQIEKNMNTLAKNKVLQGKDIYVGPGNYFAMYVIKWLQEHGYRIKGVFTSKEEHEQMSFMGYKLRKEADILIPYKHRNLILLTDGVDTHLGHRLDALGYFYQVQRYVVMYNSERKGWFTNKILQVKEKAVRKICRPSLKSVSRLYRAGVVYQKIIRDRPQTTFLLFPHKSLGDICILGSYKKQKDKIFERKHTLVVIGDNCKKLAENVGFSDVVQVSQEEMESLVWMKEVFGQSISDVHILHFQYFFTEITSGISPEGKLNFYQEYKYLVFQNSLTDLVKPKEPISDALEFCKKHGIIKRNTVILAPYAKSIHADITPFWEMLAILLKRDGYLVMTNCGNEYELPVYGTKRICFPITYANTVMEYAGYFVGFRSGLCDIISKSECGKVMIYPKLESEKISVKEHFSFTSILTDHLIKEYECSEKNLEKDAQNVAMLVQSFRSIL